MVSRPVEEENRALNSVVMLSKLMSKNMGRALSLMACEAQRFPALAER